VIDGYIGNLYARLRTKQSGSATWVCTRLQPEGGTEYIGGKFVAGGAVNPTLFDTNSAACAQQPGYVHHEGGFLGGNPFSLDSWRGDNDAWVCLTAAGTGARVRLSTGDGSLPFVQDNPALAASPTRTPWTTGVPSADCELQPLGTKTRLVNAVLSGVQVWVTAWQSGSKTQLCVRATQGSTTAGGRFTIDASPGVTPVLQIGSDTTGCNTARPLFASEIAKVAVMASDGNTNPASVCVTQGHTTAVPKTIRLTAGATGNVNQNMVQFTKD
jgi:hypothetical protein